MRVLNEQKESNLVALRRLRAQHESNVYLCGGAFFQRVGKETALKEIEERRERTIFTEGVDNQRIDKNIAENRSEYEIQVKKLHQMGLYGF